MSDQIKAFVCFTDNRNHRAGSVFTMEAEVTRMFRPERITTREATKGILVESIDSVGEFGRGRVCDQHRLLPMQLNQFETTQCNAILEGCRIIVELRTERDLDGYHFTMHGMTYAPPPMDLTKYKNRR